MQLDQESIELDSERKGPRQNVNKVWHYCLVISYIYLFIYLFVCLFVCLFSCFLMVSTVSLMHHDPDRSWITDPEPDHRKGTHPKPPNCRR